MRLVLSTRSPCFLLLWFVVVQGSALGGCQSGGRGDMTRNEERFEKRRHAMVQKQIEARGVKDPRVLEAMRDVPRHRFVPPDLAGSAYEDYPLPIGYDQTISQPYIVAAMTELLDLEPGEKVLEIGTGSGYQAAVLAEITERVFSIEIVPELAEAALRNLRAEGYDSVQVRAGDGYRGWPEEAPFQGIIVTAAPDHVPQPLIDQLDEGGRLVIPVGDVYQELVVLRKENGEIRRRTVIPVRFVPMTGEAEGR
ncbi:MAG: protein-L-isoaspartate(D-aspartate) O-methyltransferase [Candidatus Eisenbacteria bacterium]